jgi:hypothetical protein
MRKPVLVPSTVTTTLSLVAPFPKSQILFQLRVIDGEIQNQVQMAMLLGSLNEGSVKYWLLAATVLALPVRNALYELAPNGPETCDVGEDAEAVSAPVTPDVSRRSSPGLNV